MNMSLFILGFILFVTCQMAIAAENPNAGKNMGEEQNMIWREYAIVVGTLIALVASGFGCLAALNKHIDDRISKALSSPQKIKEISEKLRPFVIFNEHGVILYDNGGLRIVGDIDVRSPQLSEIFITLNAPQYIAVIPYLEILDASQGSYTAKRLKGKGIEYDLTYASLVGSTERQFRIEVLI
jgi:hypothetical protein